MGFENDKIARREMLCYLKLHRLHSTNIVCRANFFFFFMYLKIFLFYYLGKNVKILA